MSTRLELDICTPEGKTWLAEVTGQAAKFGLERNFLHPVSKTTSKSGKTGTATYIVEDGFYESNEGRRKLGRRYWIVAAGEVTETDLDGLLDALEGDQS